MKRFAVRFAVLAAFGVALVAVSTGQTTAANADDPTIKQVMQKVNGKGGLQKAIEKALKSDEPKWDDIESKAKELTPLAKSLGKNKPPKGDEDSWKKHSEAYAKAAEELEEAAGKKDAKAATSALKGISACMGCHTEHRPAKKKN